MGLILSVYKTDRTTDSSMNGVTNRCDQLCVVNVEGPFAPSPTCLPVELREGPAPNTAVLIPLEVGDSRPMFGGNYATTSDSRFSRAVDRITGNSFYGAVPVHDRVEA